MSRQYSVATVLRMTPKTLLAECFRSLGHHELDDMWPSLKKQDVEPIRIFMARLTAEQSAELEGVLRNVWELACDSGIQALTVAREFVGSFQHREWFPEKLCPYGKAIWVWLHDRRTFEKALVFHQVDRMRLWRKRQDLPRVEPDTSIAALEKLRDQVSALLRPQGRGKQCSIDVERIKGKIGFLVHPDDYVTSIASHDNKGRLSPAKIRPTMGIAFWFDPVEGVLETYARLPKDMKERLEAIFANTILHHALALYEPDPVYDLNRFKDPSFHLTTDPADGVHVRIRRMQLTACNGGRRLLIEVDDDPDDSIPKALAECVNLECMPLSTWNVTMVTACFIFLPRGERKAGQQSCDICYPRSCTLRDARPERVELIQKYLREWKIEVAAGPQSDSETLGS